MWQRVPIGLLHNDILSWASLKDVSLRNVTTFTNKLQQTCWLFCEHKPSRSCEDNHQAVLELTSPWIVCDKV